MNELTEQLIKKFTADLFNKTGIDVRVYEPFLEETERFAELIVQDCITQIAMIGVSN